MANGFMELLTRYGKVVRLDCASFVLMSKISQLLLGHGTATKPEIFEAYKQVCIENIKKSHPDLEAIYNQEVDKREMILQIVLEKIRINEEDKYHKTLAILRDNIDKKDLDVYDIYFNELLEYLSKDKHEEVRKQSKEKEANFYNGPSLPLDDEKKYTYEADKLSEIFYHLKDYYVITDSKYELYHFEKDVALADFSKSYSSFKSARALGIVFSFLSRIDCIDGRQNWYGDAVRSINRTKQRCHSDFGDDVRKTEHNWLHKICKELDIRIEKLSA